MEIIKKVLNDALILKPEIFQDDRGHFFESFNREKFEHLIECKIEFIQDNQSRSSKGVLRGIHYQSGKAAQSKLVRVVQGSVFDVAVDLRPWSTSFMQWYAVELTAKNHLQFFIPKGFGHAFLALEDETIFQYKVDNHYDKYCDHGILWNDVTIGIEWPKIEKHLSIKDEKLPPFLEAFKA